MNLREEILRIISSMEYRRHPNEPFGARLADALVTFIRNNPQSVPHKCPVCEGNDWISVEDRLPEDFIEVLIYGPFFASPVQSFRKKGHWHGSYEVRDEMRDGYVNDSTICSRITHWMSLPSPPKTEN